MSETKPEYLLAGSTKAAPHGAKSANNLQSGKEPPAMLLALLNSVLQSMTSSQQAKIIGDALIGGRRATIIIVYDALPTAAGLKMAVPTRSENE